MAALKKNADKKRKIFILLFLSAFVLNKKKGASLLAIKKADKSLQINLSLLICLFSCGERGIRTPGTSQYNGFQDRRDRPLCHLSKTSFQKCFFSKAMQRYDFFLNLQVFSKFFLFFHHRFSFTTDSLSPQSTQKYEHFTQYRVSKLYQPIQ